MLHLTYGDDASPHQPERAGLRDVATAGAAARSGPGAKLSLHDLATQLGVSRSPVHHALTRLVSEGLLSVKARRGYYVTPVTSASLVDGYDVRLALELHAATRTVGSADPAQLERFHTLMEESEAAISQEEWDTANAAFHEHQIDIAGASRTSPCSAAAPSCSRIRTEPLPAGRAHPRPSRAPARRARRRLEAVLARHRSCAGRGRRRASPSWPTIPASGCSMRARSAATAARGVVRGELYGLTKAKASPQTS